MSDIEIDVSIGANFFAPKCIDRNENFDTRNSHVIASSKCNFNCSFCKHGLKQIQPNYMKFYEFETRIDELMQQGRMFKFTGGEPCLNPNLEKMMKIIKQKGGVIFLDTNGSMFEIIKDLLNKNLIDVLGVSLKGLTSEEAQITSGIQNVSLCWDNVIKIIKLGASYENVRVIVTYVAYNNFNVETLYRFANILDEIGDNLYLKINNLCGNEYRDMSLKALKRKVLPKMMSKFVKDNPKWKKRTILINSSEGVTKYSKISFF